MADGTPTLPRESHSTTLCLSCGICCTGVLHPSAHLRHEELELAAALGLKVLDPTGEDPDPYFELGCHHFQGRCSVFPHRPRVCGDYQCRLLTDYLEERITLEEGLAVVREARENIARVEAKVSGRLFCSTVLEQTREALARMDTTSPEGRRDYMELLLSSQALRITLTRRFLKEEAGRKAEAEGPETGATG